MIAVKTGFHVLLAAEKHGHGVDSICEDNFESKLDSAWGLEPGEAVTCSRASCWQAILSSAANTSHCPIVPL